MRETKVTIWGSRGSCVVTDFKMLGYGFNTTCISIETENIIYIIDAGSGITDFDKYYYENNLVNKKIVILFTHYHHDHLWGLGFTDFLFDSNIEVELIGPGDIKATINRYFGAPFFPVKIVDLPNLVFKSINENSTYTFYDMVIDTVQLEHTPKCLGYKFYLNDKTICFIIDYEYQVDKNKHLVEEFVEHCDHMIIDAFSTKDDYTKGWGHSCIDDCVELFEKMNVKNCILTHHNPKYNDDFIDDLAKKYSSVVFARDKMSIMI